MRGVYGLWFIVYGVWFMVYGSGFMVPEARAHNLYLKLLLLRDSPLGRVNRALARRPLRHYRLRGFP